MLQYYNLLIEQVQYNQGRCFLPTLVRADRMEFRNLACEDEKRFLFFSRTNQSLPLMKETGV